MLFASAYTSCLAGNQTILMEKWVRRSFIFTRHAKQRVRAICYLFGRGQEYRIKAGYFFRNFEEGQRVNIIYELSQPAKGAVYNFGDTGLPGAKLFSLFS